MKLLARFVRVAGVAAFAALMVGVYGGISPTPASAKTLTPQSGGTITEAGFIQPAGLDPIVSTGHATTGAVEMLAIYDPILRYDHATGKYVNVTAQSLTHNANDTVWTLTLKPGITFSDGTPYNADAVVFEMNRERSGLPGAPACQTVWACPTNPTSSTSYMRYITDVTAVNPTTVQFTLDHSWAGFPFVLSAEPSYIPSPTAMMKDCPNPTLPPSQCSFSTHPVGAGPFMVQSFVPGVALTSTGSSSSIRATVAAPRPSTFSPPARSRWPSCVPPSRSRRPRSSTTGTTSSRPSQAPDCS
jgi:ABC-type transport system substrate-binding protein